MQKRAGKMERRKEWEEEEDVGRKRLTRSRN
jgi:hypothetical protein